MTANLDSASGRDQARENAHLRPLRRCQAYGCERPATQELYNGVNARSGVYRHAENALENFKKGRP